MLAFQSRVLHFTFETAKFKKTDDEKNHFPKTTLKINSLLGPRVREDDSVGVAAQPLKIQRYIFL